MIGVVLLSIRLFLEAKALEELIDWWRRRLHRGRSSFGHLDAHKVTTRLRPFFRSGKRVDASAGRQS